MPKSTLPWLREKSLAATFHGQGSAKKSWLRLPRKFVRKLSAESFAKRLRKKAPRKSSAKRLEAKAHARKFAAKVCENLKAP